MSLSRCHPPPLLCALLISFLFLALQTPCGGADAGRRDQGGGTPWASPAEEALDERRDAEIFEAVVSSMAQWQRRHEHRKHQREKRASENVVCYEDVGCFRDAGPFSYLDMLPSPPDEVSTHFLFYSRLRPYGLLLPFSNISSSSSSSSSPPPSPPPSSQVAERSGRPVRDSGDPDPATISTSFSSSPSDSNFAPSTAFSPSQWVQAGLNVSVPTKVIVHGFGSSCSNVWVFEMRSALMSVEECNVICVDWEAGATIPNYVRAAANTRLVGKQLALLLGRLRDTVGLDLQRVHLIGFSLGAHVAGFAGAELRNLSRITGLDPAGPLFESQDPLARLDSGDATFVDVIHSNGENLILGGLGSWQPMGHVDFYPNGGRMQKGCSNLFVGAVSDIFWSSTEAHGRSLCNHRRAYKFFTDSVSPRCHFPAVPCESYEKFLEGSCLPCSSHNRCGNMGYYADRSNGRGTLYLITRDEEPFCAHQYLVKVESTPSALPVVSYGKIQITILGAIPEANETFTLTHKDDEELKAGGSLSRIVVPHPVMEEPLKVEVLYLAYSGWISSGLARWSIDKVTIGDSFGKSSSFCNKGLILESGLPVTLPLYPGDCNPPNAQLSIYAPSIAVPHLPVPMLPSAPVESTNTKPSQDKWTTVANDNEINNPSKVESASPSSVNQGTLVVSAGDEGLDAHKDGLSKKANQELTSNKNENKKAAAEGGEEWDSPKRNSTKGAEVTPPGIGAGQEDPLLSPLGPEATDESNSSWKPFTNEGPSNSLSPDGSGGREDAARAFVDPGEVSNSITKRNDPPSQVAKAAEAKEGNGTAPLETSAPSKRSPGPPSPQWRPRHIPIYSAASLYEARGGWHPEMMPPDLDPPPIHAPITWQHWIGFEDDQRTPPSAATREQRQEDPKASSKADPPEASPDPSPPPPPTANATASSEEPKAEWRPGGPFAPVVETVQLLPQRLAAFLARAEEYARVTLSGMVLGMGAGGPAPAAPGGNESSGDARRKPKYFPPMSLSSDGGGEKRRGGRVAAAEALPSKASSVGAMGRGQPQYYPGAVVGQGDERPSEAAPANPSPAQESEGRPWQKVGEGAGGVEGRHRPRYIPLQRPQMSQEGPKPVTSPARRSSMLTAFVAPRRRRR